MRHTRFAFAFAAALLTAGSAFAQSLSECEQTIQYNLAAPSPDVPANLASFSGVWVGKWGNALCSVLIVEDVGKDGSVAAKYAWGTFAQWNINRPGISAYTGKIINGVLTLRRNNLSIEYRMAGPNELSGIYTANTQEKGSFKKR